MQMVLAMTSCVRRRRSNGLRVNSAALGWIELEKTLQVLFVWMRSTDNLSRRL